MTSKRPLGRAPSAARLSCQVHDRTVTSFCCGWRVGWQQGPDRDLEKTTRGLKRPSLSSRDRPTSPCSDFGDEQLSGHSRVWSRYSRNFASCSLRVYTPGPEYTPGVHLLRDKALHLLGLLFWKGRDYFYLQISIIQSILVRSVTKRDFVVNVHVLSF